MSEPIELTQGVHQGSVLSLLLFNIFINDIGDDLTVNDAPFLHRSKISHLLYADDLLLLSTSETELQHNINIINAFCMKWGLAINVDKVVLFSKNGRVSKDRFMFSVGQTCLECVAMLLSGSCIKPRT